MFTIQNSKDIKFKIQKTKFKNTKFKRHNVKSHFLSLLCPLSQPDQHKVSRDRDSAPTRRVLGIRERAVRMVS